MAVKKYLGWFRKDKDRNRKRTQKTREEDSAQREGETVAHSSSPVNNIVSNRKYGKEEETEMKREHNLVQQTDHSNTDLFTD